MAEKQIKLSYNNLSKLISPYKVNIIKILKKEKKLNLSQLQKALKISSRETRRHTSKLIKAGILKRAKKLRTRGSPVYISLK
ncbi:hypothetical protein ES702_02319 [subsurface metagenome]